MASAQATSDLTADPRHAPVLNLLTARSGLLWEGGRNQVATVRPDDGPSPPCSAPLSRPGSPVRGSSSLLALPRYLPRHRWGSEASLGAVTLAAARGYPRYPVPGRRLRNSGHRYVSCTYSVRVSHTRKMSAFVVTARYSSLLSRKQAKLPNSP